MDSVNVLGLAGSLRKESFNRALLKEAVEIAPEGINIEPFELHGIPGFNQDEEQNPPEIIVDLKQKIRDADAVLFVTPEYNYSVTGVLKNAMDWASRPYGDNAFEGKPAAIMGASISMFGSARAQYHLRQMFVFLDVHPVNQPEVMIPSASEKFDDDGNLTDEMSTKLVRQLLENLKEWAKVVNSSTELHS